VKILHIIPYMHPVAGGPPVVVDRFACELIRRGNEVTVMTTDALTPAGDKDWQQMYDGGYELTVFPAYRRSAFGYCPALKAALNERVADYDIVHLHNLWGYTNIAATAACRRHRVPFVVSSHGMLDPHSLRRQSIKKTLYGRFVEFPRLRLANGMIFTHREEGRLAALGCPGLPRGYVVPLGADKPPKAGVENAVSELASQHPEFADKRLVLFFGRIHPKKGIDLLIPAFEELRKRIPNAHLVCAGPTAPGYEQTFQTLIERHGVGRHVTLLGPVYAVQKWAILLMCHVFVLPSYQENFAITVVEALRMGLPVVLSDRVNIVEDVVAAAAGVRTNLDTTAIADALAGILADEPARLRLAHNGPKLVERQFTWESATDALFEAYRTVATVCRRRNCAVAAGNRMPGELLS
jgi:glycosyltransferase involved in cell wall biosynthesis